MKYSYFLLLIFSFVFVTTNAQTITFSTPLGNGGTSILDGDLGSSNIGDFEITSQPSGADLFLINDTFFVPSLGLAPDSDGLSLSANTGVVISTTDNSLFSFEGFSFFEIDGNIEILIIQGYRAGVAIGSPTNLTANLGSFIGTENTFHTSDLPSANFNAIDSVVITVDSPYSGLFNNFKVGTPTAVCTEPDVPSVTADAICAGEDTTLNITGNLNDATEWKLYSDAAGTTLVDSSVTPSFTVTGLMATTTYYVRGEGGCTTPGTLTSVEVPVNPTDNASFSYDSAAYCVNGIDPSPTITGLTGGTFTSTAGLSIASNGTIDVSASTPNTYTVTYMTAGMCSNSETASVTINASDDASFSYGAIAYGTEDTDPTPTIGLAGGEFSNPVGLDINITTGEIDLSDSTPGDYMVTYTTNGTCPNSSMVNISIYARPTITSISTDSGISTTDYITNDNTPTVNGTATPNSIITITVNGTSSSFVGISVTTDSFGNYIFPFPIVFGSLPDDTATFSVTSTINGLSLISDSQTATIDTTAPLISSITRQSPTTSPTNADALTWDVTFDGAVNNVDATDFTVSGTTGTIVSVTNPSGNVYRITASGGDLAALNATVTLGFGGGQDITDIAGNTLTNLIPTGTNNNTFVVENTPPTFTWTGATDNDWDTASNWDSNTVPTATTDVIIPSGLTLYPTTDNNITVNSITIQSGASFLPLADSSVTGEITYIKDLPNTDFHLMSSPVFGETIGDVNSNNNLSVGTINSDLRGFGIFNNNTDPRYEYFDTTVPDFATVEIPNGFGFFIKLETAGPISFTGTAVTTTLANIPINTGFFSDFNLVGNPYTTYIDAATFTEDNESLLTERTIWVWDGTQYTTYNNTEPFAIAPAQGFFVEATTTDIVTFDIENRAHQSTGVVLKQVPNPKFELFIDNGTLKNSTKIFYIADKTTGFDNGYDSKMFNNDYELAIFTELVTENTGSKLAIQTVPATYDAVIPVGVIAKAGEEILFSIENINLPEGIDVYLEDKLTGEFVNLSETTYKTTLKEDTDSTGQFYVHTTAAKVLSTENITTNNNISIYKSAAQTLTISGLNTTGSITMYSLSGKEVFNTTVNSNTVNLPNLNAGIYIVTLNSEFGTITKKVSLN